MKEGREIMKLGDVCKVIAGQSPRGNAYNDKGLGVEFHQGKKAFGKDVIQPSGVWTTEITKMAEAGDILMSVRAPVGPTNYTDRSVCIGRGLAAIRCSELVLPQYILYALKNIESKIVGKDGAVFNSISKDMIEDLPVPKLPLSEQQRIVSLLDAEFAKIDTLKANAERNLQNAKDLFQAALKKELEPKEGWKNKKLGEVCDIINGRNQKAVECTDGEYPIYGSGGNVMGYASDYLCKEGTTIIGRKGSINNPIYIDTKFWNVDTAFGISAKPMMSSKFVYYFCRSFDFSKLNKGTTIPSLVKKDLLIIDISTPSLSEQQTIVARLDALNEKCNTLQANYEKTIDLCDDLKQALLRKAFNGEI